MKNKPQLSAGWSLLENGFACFWIYVLLAATYAIVTWWTNPTYQKEIPFEMFIAMGCCLILYWSYLLHIIYCAKRGRRSFLAPPR